MSKPIPHELIVQILTYLPVKSLIQFKCVSKSWYLLISSSQFAKLHLKRVKEENNINRHSKILLTNSPVAYSVDFEEEAIDADHNYQAVLEFSYPEAFVCRPNFYFIEILGSCNGLVCLSNENFDIMLWNPSTRLSKILPKPDISLGHILFSGLGYDESTDDYKLIVASEYNATGARETTAEIFTLGSNSWKKIQDLDDIVGVVLSLGIYFDQSLYWLGWREIDGKTEISTFDIAEERFKKVLTLPNNCEKDCLYSINLGTSKNRLCLFCESRGSYFETLVLDGFGTNNATWTELFKVPHDTFGGYNDIQLCVTNKGKIVFDSDGWRLGLYDPYQYDSKITSFNIRNRNECESAVYLETLVSPYY